MRKLIATFLASITGIVIYSQVEIGNALFDNFEYKSAIKYFTLADSLPKEAEEKLAYSFLFVKDYQSAEKQFNILLNSDPDNLDYAYLHALCVKNKDEFKNQLLYLEQFVSLIPPIN